MLASVTEALDDRFVGDAVIEHLIDLVAERLGQPGDLAVAPGLGLAVSQLEVEVVV
jgi:hypothetical protein